MSEIVVRSADWRTESELLWSVRAEVFIEEQKVPEDIERDGRDPDCFHAIALAEGDNVVGTARMDRSGHLGRVAVRRPWRGQGIGSRLVRFFVEHAETMGLRRIELNAQLHTRDFYEALGFVVCSDLFEEAGIEHITMALDIHDSR